MELIMDMILLCLSRGSMEPDDDIYKISTQWLAGDFVGQFDNSVLEKMKKQGRKKKEVFLTVGKQIRRTEENGFEFEFECDFELDLNWMIVML